MLKPDERPERLRRSLSLARNDYVEHIKFGNQARDELPPDLLHPDADEQMLRLRRRRSEVEAVLEGLGGPYDINLTNEVVPKAVEVIRDERVRAQALLQWRWMSGAVHALVWHHYGQQGTSVSDLDEERIGRIEIRGDVGRLVMAYFSGFHLTVAGWELFAVRSGIPELIPPSTDT
jgi:hypothetical protein